MYMVNTHTNQALGHSTTMTTKGTEKTSWNQVLPLSPILTLFTNITTPEKTTWNQVLPSYNYNPHHNPNPNSSFSITQPTSATPF